MAIKYTPNQQRAIETRHQNLLISAAAGSGKTRVLVDRIVHLIKNDHVALPSMLIVTFTNAAAGEMRARLKQALEEAILAEEGDIHFLREQLKTLPSAHISTMHAFCISELKRFYHVLDIDANFRILPETTTALLKESAMEKTMTDAYNENSEDFLRLVEAYGGKNSDDDLRDMVSVIYRRIQAHPDPLAWFEEMAVAADGPLPEAFQKRFCDLIAEYCDQIQNDIDRSEKMILPFLGELTKTYDNILDDASFVRGLRHCLDKADAIECLMQYMTNNKLVTKARKPKNISMEAEEAEGAFKTLRDEYKKTIEKVKKLLPEEGIDGVNEDRQITAQYLQTLVHLVRSFAENYMNEKREKEGLDYDDLEHFMLKLLEDAQVRESIRQEINYVFFDEYQDANPIQEAIVEGLATPEHLFFVGDVKQAIYRFRRADPKIFNRRYHCYRDTEDGELIFLSENFRSRKEILDFSNALFTTLMTPTLGDVDYSEPGQSLVCGGNFEPQDDAVQIVAITSEEKKTAEPLWIAQEIKRLVASGAYGYGDIVVLMRSPRNRLATFEDIFQQMDIPFYSDNSETSFQNLEVRLFISMLNVLQNDELDNPLLASLLSPFGGLNDEEVALIRSRYQENSLAKAVKMYRDEYDDATSQKLQQFFAHLEHWRSALRYESLAQVGIRIFEESGYAAFLLGMEKGIERHSNVNAFIDIMEAYDQDQHNGLSGFLAYVRTLEAKNMDSATQAIGLSEADACVRLMSIHKSKGLGFKVVFLADTTHMFNLRDAHYPIVIDDELGVALRVVDLERATKHSPFEKNIFMAKFNDETRSEEVRLLYVALTRAIDRLYLVGSPSAKAMEKKLDSCGKVQVSTGALKNRSSYFDWIMDCLCDDHHPLALNGDKKLYQWHLLDDEVLQQNSEEDAIIIADTIGIALDDEVVENIAQRFDTSYLYEADTKKPYKKTVSELTKGNDLMPPDMQKWPTYWDRTPSASETIPMPAFLQEHISFTAANFGTLMHQTIQLLPIEQQKSDQITARLDQLVVDAFLTLEERNAVDEKMLNDFYQSDFVAWMNQVGYHFEKEVSFTMRVDEWVVDGQIDLFFETDEGYHIVDFKTDRDIRLERYTKQLDMYARALSAARGKPVVKKWLYWLRHQVATEV